MDRKNVFIRLDPELHRRLKVGCAKAGLSMQELIQWLIEDWLSPKETPDPLARRGPQGLPKA